MTETTDRRKRWMRERRKGKYREKEIEM